MSVKIHVYMDLTLYMHIHGWLHMCINNYWIANLQSNEFITLYEAVGIIKVA